MALISTETRLDAYGTWLGFKRLLPLSMFVVAFGLAFGLAAAQAGLSKFETLLMSGLVFAGASQFAALELWQQDIPLLTIMITTFAINARHLLMGASLYPWLCQLPPGKRYGILTVISDANWAMAVQDYQRGERNLGILFGGGLALWVTWMLGTWLGLILTQGIPDPQALGLDMVLGCFLLTMAVGGKKNARLFTIWAVAAMVTLLALWLLPPNSHVVAGALAGGLVGALWLEPVADHGKTADKDQMEVDS
ncbi:AzlC family ABC transporter permease [Marinospirillum alkaliphilum]|uniref:Predicted branched-chain amino acid permease (Azaleucine resistance) n=1 Tax=Marinospirillum alkaliphilum DSM 21637 TaxID=1122209 RepID=A0A1K1U375_9GAMM|nr:AzlC family ABC transporter permease [Marinospirillum alkaliphilum]SFX06821.1 Predicted branched-chain amino acid permease (azaleucine resistance) [Marinospirillum alkaliphilum DSM 21637]